MCRFLAFGVQGSAVRLRNGQQQFIECFLASLIENLPDIGMKILLKHFELKYKKKGGGGGDE